MQSSPGLRVASEKLESLPQGGSVAERDRLEVGEVRKRKAGGAAKATPEFVAALATVSCVSGSDPVWVHTTDAIAVLARSWPPG